MKYFIIIYILCFLFLNSCPAPEMPEPTELPKDDNPIFAGANRIITLLPLVDENDTSITPQFTWTVTGNKFVYLGLFTESIDVKNNRITNIEDNIWAWHSGIGKGREGDVLFSEGYDVVNGSLDKTHAPTSLSAGYTYYWAVWAWDEYGLSISDASRENYFTTIP